MAVPTYDQMLRPLLELATQQDIRRNSATILWIRDHFRLTDADMALRIPSGMGVVLNRAGWAMTDLTKAGLIERVAPKCYHATDQGRAFLQQHTGDFGKRELATIESYREWKYASRKTQPELADTQTDVTHGEQTPVEVIDAAVETLHADVRQRLLDAILAQDPEFFERLVLDVLNKMGYGGIHQDAVLHTGRSGDEGIDGRINQDALGLDQVLVQAKRFAPDQTVSRKEIQAFIGSLAGQGVTKGVFITTSNFAASAQEFVQRGSQTKVVLIDGNALIDLMMRFKVGVRVERSVEVLDIDQNYFSEE